MLLFWSLAAALHAGSALVSLVLGARHRAPGALVLGLWLAVLAAWCASRIAEPGESGVQAWLAGASALLGVAATLQHLRQRAQLAESEAKASALVAEARAMVKEDSSKVQASRSRFRHLVEVTPLGIFEADEHGDYVFVSRRWRELTGIDSQAAKGGGWLSAVKGAERARVREAWDEATAAGEAFAMDWPLAESGSVAWVHCQATPRTVEHDESLAYIGTLTDVTGRKRAEEEHRRHQESEAQAKKLESLGVMAGGIAHDFNNLLVGVLGNAELLKPRLAGNTDGAKVLSRIVSAARRAAALANQMLVFAGEGVVERVALDVNDAVGDCLAVLSESERRRVRFEAGAELPTILADRIRLQQIITNLVQNALEASEDRDEPVTVVTETRAVAAAELDSARLESELEAGELVVLEVSDSGCGIEPEDLPRVFDPFFSTKFAGRGLGLGVVSGAIRANGGSLKIDSGPGRGTRVRAYFQPHGDPASQRSEGGGAASWSSSGGRLLVVDDEPVVIDTLQAMLEDTGYSVEVAESGEQAVALLKDKLGELDAVLLDMTMPGMNGRETLRELRKIDADIPVILLSGHPGEVVQRAFANDELADFIIKPFTSDRLLSSLERALSQPRPSSQS